MQKILKQIEGLINERNTFKEKLGQVTLDCEIAETKALELEDERNIYLKQLEEIYEAIVGADGINRYTHDEIIDRIYDLYDVYTKYVNEEEV